MKTTLNPATIILDIQDHKITLTLEEAESLVATLQETIKLASPKNPFEKLKRDIEKINTNPRKPDDKIWPNGPYIPSPTYPWKAPEIYCGTIDTKTT